MGDKMEVMEKVFNNIEKLMIEFREQSLNDLKQN